MGPKWKHSLGPLNVWACVGRGSRDLTRLLSSLCSTPLLRPFFPTCLTGGGGEGSVGLSPHLVWAPSKTDRPRECLHVYQAQGKRTTLLDFSHTFAGQGACRMRGALTVH